jgi:hypothetical protein
MKPVKRRLLNGALTALLVTALGAISTASPARASGGGEGCNPGRSSSDYPDYLFGGVYSGNPNIQSGGAIGGIRGNIETYSPWVSAVASNDDVSAWVMLDSTGLDGKGRWAQIGWNEFPHTGRNTFWQYVDDADNIVSDFSLAPTSIGSVNSYTVDYAPGGTFKMLMNGTVEKTFQALYWAPTDAQSYGEIHTQGSQFPGGANDPDHFSSMQVWPVAGPSSSWQNLDGVGSADRPFIHFWSPEASGNVSAFVTWDSACAN